MARLLTIFVLCACCLDAATVRLYLKDGTHQLVREYKVQSDRVRYYSVERGDWEEIPLDLTDIKRTQDEAKDKDEKLARDTAEAAAEDKAERDAAREIARVPYNAGVYAVVGEELKTVPVAESKLITDKKRSILKALSPIPMVAGKATIEIDGLASKTAVPGPRPEFYIRLSEEQRFGIVRVTPGKGKAPSRVVMNVSIVPVSKEMIEEHDDIEIFRRQVGNGLYKIWPTKELPPGEYAVIEYTEGKVNPQIWDFRLE